MLLRLAPLPVAVLGAPLLRIPLPRRLRRGRPSRLPTWAGSRGWRALFGR